MDAREARRIAEFRKSAASARNRADLDAAWRMIVEAAGDALSVDARRVAVSVYDETIMRLHAEIGDD